MHIGQTVDWNSDVLASWQRSAAGDALPNPDVWSALPHDVCWFSGRIEPQDIKKIYVIGSYDWKEVFQSYCLHQIAELPANETDDAYQHNSRILNIKNAMATGDRFEPIILTAFSGEGPFVIADGNHRAIAMAQLGILVEQPVFVGFHKNMGRDFNWFRRAVLNED